MSNCAATLLGLNQREEAKKQWLQAIHLRPSYFEAVEHLVGLLCGDHNGREAVKVIEFVEQALRNPHFRRHESLHEPNRTSQMTGESNGSQGIPNAPRALSLSHLEHSQIGAFEAHIFSIPPSENGRLLALVHAKGNLLYGLGDVSGAAKAFEEAVLISTGHQFPSTQALIRTVLTALSTAKDPLGLTPWKSNTGSLQVPLLLPPDEALQTARLVFPGTGELPGLRDVAPGIARKAAISTTSNSLLSLAKIFQDLLSNNNWIQAKLATPPCISDILALYYLSLSLAPSPSTANNVGILLAGVQQPASNRTQKVNARFMLPPLPASSSNEIGTVPGVQPGSGVALALAYYNYGLNLDPKHAHLYTNLGSLLKDLGQLTAAIKMYEQAVACDGTFDIALANLANAIKDQGRTSDAIQYYRRAVASSPDFAEAVCGLANALNSVCNWAGRGGVRLDEGRKDRWHVNESGMIIDALETKSGGGWMQRIVDIVAKQLKEGLHWGRGVLHDYGIDSLLQEVEHADTGSSYPSERRTSIHSALVSWAGHRAEGARIVRLIERAIKRVQYRWYHDKYIKRIELPASHYGRPGLPGGLAVPPAPTVLPFHTFTCPLSAKDIRMISQRNALRISTSTLRTSWFKETSFPPPRPPQPQLNIGYVSSDFNNHPLAHLYVYPRHIR